MGDRDRKDEDSRKLFIGGLSAETTKEHLEDYFGQYGAVQMATIKTDVFTSRSRGFGFLIFEDKSSVDQVVAQGSKHEINGKVVEAKLATPQSTGSEEANSKVFVGGLQTGTTKEQVREVFEQRGRVVDVFVPMDRETNELKGFAFVTFDESSLASSLCDEGKIMIEGKECDIKRAKNKNDAAGGRGGRGGRGGFQGGRGGYGGGRGGYGGGRGGYDQYGGGGYGGSGYEQPYYSGGYGGGQQYSQYEQYGGYESAGYGGYGGDQNGGGYGSGGYGQDQYKMKGSRGRGGYNPY